MISHSKLQLTGYVTRVPRNDARLLRVDLVVGRRVEHTGDRRPLQLGDRGRVQRSPRHSPRALLVVAEHLHSRASHKREALATVVVLVQGHVTGVSCVWGIVFNNFDFSKTRFRLSATVQLRMLKL